MTGKLEIGDKLRRMLSDGALGQFAEVVAVEGSRVLIRDVPRERWLSVGMARVYYERETGEEKR